MKPEADAISTRRRANEYAQEAHEDGVLDLRDCEFIGGGVADELLWLAEDRAFTIQVSENGVADMLQVISQRRFENGISDKRFDDIVSVSR